MLYSRPATWKDPPRGLKGNPDQMIAVTFYVLLPVSLWEFDDKSDEVYIRFGSDKLGDWQCDVGPMTVNKYVINIIYSYRWS